MSSIIFDDMDSGNLKILYNRLWGDNPKILEKIVRTKTKNKEGVIVDSYNSYSFDDSNLKGADLLISLFGLNEEQCKIKYKEACSGSGSEGRRILTFHSSSLCAFLFFYNVTKDNSLKLKLNGNDCVFDNVVFEYKNEVTEDGGPSNIDVVLLGIDKKSNNKVILFLESKFSEYYTSIHSQIEIRNAYQELERYDIYENDKLKEIGLNIENIDSERFKLKSVDTHYLEGIKQMISHFIGVNNFCGNQPLIYDQDKTSIVKEYQNDNTEIYLGEILFTTAGVGRLKIGRDKRECFNDYSNLYKKLINLLRIEYPKSKVILLDKLLEYSCIPKNHNVEEKIKTFYSIQEAEDGKAWLF